MTQIGDIKGVPLDTFQDELHRVSEEFNACPRAEIDLSERLNPKVIDYIVNRFGEDERPAEILHRLPLEAFAGMTFDELCKIRYSTIFMMDSSVDTLFRDDPRYQIVHKIESSMWRWGMGKDVWNEVVNAYEAIRGFTLPVPDLEIRLDYTTSFNERGYSEHSRTFLDGVFAFLLYYRGEHVMTLGFSIMTGKRLLLQQVQLKKRRGNRWLFRLPANRMEFFVGVFRDNFPGYAIYVADGGELVTKSLNSYSDGLKRYSRDDDLIKELETKIAHLEADLPRLATFYADTGRFKLGKTTVKVNGLTHYRVAA